MTDTIESNTVEQAQVRGNRKTRVGKVVSDKQSKTIIVEILSRVPHKRYKKSREVPRPLCGSR